MTCGGIDTGYGDGLDATPQAPITTELWQRFKSAIEHRCPACGALLPARTLLDIMAGYSAEKAKQALEMRSRCEVTVDEKLMLSGAGMPKTMEPDID